MGKYLNEENYERGKKKVTFLALIVLVLGLLFGGSLIAIGLKKQSNVNDKYSESSKKSLSEQIAIEKENLKNKKAEIEAKIKPIQDEIKSLEREKINRFDDAYYARQDKIEELAKSISEDINSINAIEEALDESFDYCNFYEAKNNSNTAKYCSLRNELDDINSGFRKSFESSKSIPFFIFGAFVIIASCIAAGSIYMFSKKREIAAFTTQQVMPVAKEGIDEMAPTIGNAVGEIAKGIKKGLKDDDKK